MSTIEIKLLDLAGVSPFCPRCDDDHTYIIGPVDCFNGDRVKKGKYILKCPNCLNNGTLQVYGNIPRCRWKHLSDAMEKESSSNPSRRHFQDEGDVNNLYKVEWLSMMMYALIQVDRLKAMGIMQQRPGDILRQCEEIAIGYVKRQANSNPFAGFAKQEGMPND